MGERIFNGSRKKINVKKGVAHLEGSSQVGVALLSAFFLPIPSSVASAAVDVTGMHPGFQSGMSASRGELHQSPIWLKRSETKDLHSACRPWHGVPQKTVGARSSPTVRRTGVRAIGGRHLLGG